MGVSKVFQGCLKGVSRKIEGDIRETFKGDSMEPQGI